MKRPPQPREVVGIALDVGEHLRERLASLAQVELSGQRGAAGVLGRRMELEASDPILM
jgi:hypothetical protein